MKFALGVGLIIGAYVIGYGLPVALGLIIKDKKTALSIATGLWLFSWIPFFIGVALAGKEGVTWVKQKLHLKSKIQNLNDKKSC
jgi:hypothetical protein